MTIPMAPRTRHRRPGTAVATALGLAALLGLGGCNTLPAAPAAAVPAALAQPAADQPHARLLVRSTLSADHRWLLVQQQDNERCSQPAAVAQAAGGAPAAVRLPPGQLTTLDFAVVPPGSNRACTSRWSFTPLAGKTYLVHGSMVGAQCTAQLLDASVPDRTAVPADLVSRVLPGQSCVPLAQSPRPQPRSALQGGQHNGEAVLNPQASTRDLEALIRRTP